MWRRPEVDLKNGYRTLIMAMLASVLALLIAAVKFWPESSPAPAIVFNSHGQDLIEIEEIVQTSQEQRRPAPPPPAIPLIVPDEVVLDQEILEFDATLVIEEALGDAGDAGDDAREVSAQGPTREARLVRIVQPDYPDAARKKSMRAEIVVQVLVDESGRVADAAVTDRFLVDKKSGDRTAVTELGYGLEDAAISAALRSVFRPARLNGAAVQGYTAVTFSFGV